MVSKCANPGCAVAFLYLHQGKLFRVDSDLAAPTAKLAALEAGARKGPLRVEYFWLCNDCARVMTLARKGSEIVTVPLARAQAATVA